MDRVTAQLVGVCLSYTKPQDSPSVLHKPGVMEHTCNLNNLEVEVDLEIQVHP